MSNRPQNTQNVAVVIPAYNEEETIGRVVQQVAPYGTVIVVNDASSDKTCACAERAGAVVVTHDRNKGYDGALNSGFKKAEELGAEYVITFDADGQHDPDDLPAFIDFLQNGADLVVGRRPKRARFAEKLFALVFWQLYGVRDPLCGLKGYRISLYKDAGCFDSCQSIGTQLTLFACRRKREYKLEQVPIAIYPRGDQARFGGIIKANYRILKAVFRVWYV